MIHETKIKEEARSQGWAWVAYFGGESCSSLQLIICIERSCLELQLLISTSSNTGTCRKTYRQTILDKEIASGSFLFCFSVIGFKWLKPTVSSHPQKQGKYLQDILFQRIENYSCIPGNHFFRVQCLKNIWTMRDFPQKSNLMLLEL